MVVAVVYGGGRGEHERCIPGIFVRQGWMVVLVGGREWILRGRRDSPRSSLNNVGILFNDDGLGNAQQW